MPQSSKDAANVRQANRNYKKLAAVVGIGAAASLVVLVPHYEGVVLKGYKDPVGIPTKCMGDTHDVVVGKKYSESECNVSLTEALLKHAQPVLACVPELKDAQAQLGHPGPIVASVDLAYNIGTSAFCKSTAAKRFRVHNWKGGCEAIGWYTRAGGRELPGLKKRRASDVEVCLTGKVRLR